jgi:hypothetical protein
LGETVVIAIFIGAIAFASWFLVRTGVAEPPKTFREGAALAWSAFLHIGAVIAAIVCPASIFVNASYGPLWAIGFVVLFLIVPFIVGLRWRSRSDRSWYQSRERTKGSPGTLQC